jgi:hypothetical protein
MSRYMDTHASVGLRLSRSVLKVELCVCVCVYVRNVGSTMQITFLFVGTISRVLLL